MELVPKVEVIVKTKCNTLQDALWSVIQEERFEDMPNVEVVGTLEYLKWNVINHSK